jgi:DNA-binding transcriptional MerR regulator
MKYQQSMRNGYYSTKELAQLFHADESTIKRWANRSKLKCFKTPGGHRKFTSEHILEFIRTYHYELNAQVSRVAESLRASQVDAKPATGTAANAPAMAELFHTLALRGDVKNMVEILHRAYLTQEPLPAIYENIVGGALRELANANRRGVLADADFYAAMRALVECVLNFRLLTPHTLPNGKVAICASMQSGAQSAPCGVMLLAACHILETRGWTIYYLGNGISPDSLDQSVAKYRPDLLCLPVEYKKHASSDERNTIYFDYLNDDESCDSVTNIETFDSMVKEPVDSFHLAKHATVR